MEVIAEMNLIFHEEALVHAPLTIGLRKVAEVIYSICRPNTITLILLAIIYVLSLALLHIIVPINVLSTFLAVVIARKRSYSAPRVHNKRLLLLRTRAYEDVDVEVLQVSAVSEEVRRLQVRMVKSSWRAMVLELA